MAAVSHPLQQSPPGGKGNPPPAEIKITISYQLFLKSCFQWSCQNLTPVNCMHIVSRESLEINYALALYSMVNGVSKP